jgi:hypothetical protein
MIMLSHPLLPSRQSAFALISVLALVSLAALTATAFLASARLERQATSSIGTTTRLEITLSTGKECAAELLDKVGQPGLGWNFVTTYWRTNIADELGYPLIGGANSRNNLRWTYYCGFTPANWTNLDTNVIGTFIKVTNLICQSSFSNDIAAFMTKATNGFSANPTSKVSTTITLVGGRTSPPIGWVYIRQNIRTNPATTNTAYLPVARFAYFIEDLQGLIDAERMGGLTLRDTGTNAEEISMSNLTSVTITNLTNYTNARGQYITPSMLLTANGGFLSSTNDLRYFASRLRSCPFNDGTNWDRIPAIPISSTMPYYPNNTGLNKRSLSTNLDSTNGLTNIAYTITNNFPAFTNRAGGMNGTNYILALAANIIDYADINSVATSTNINGVNIVGFDSYPMLTHVFDRFLYKAATKSITITTYLQFWNPSSVSTPALSGGTFTYNLNDTIRYPTNTAGDLFTNRPLSTSTLPVSNFSFSNGASTSWSFPKNCGFITSLTNTIDLSSFENFPTSGPPTVDLNTTDGSTTDNRATNSFTITGLGATNRSPLPFYRDKITLNDDVPIWMGSIVNLRMNGGVGDASSSRLSADPRMLNYIGAGQTLKIANASYANVYWQGYPAELTTALLSGHPGNWPDGYNTANTPIPTRGTNNPAVPPEGPFIILDSLTTIADPAPCKISNFGSYSNIFELGNIFDPIQWAPTTTTTNYANVDIPTGTTWTTNNLYGGGSTLRIGRPEHSRFAFTNLGGAYPTPNLGQSAAGLLDLFCVTNAYNWAGKININTAPAPVLAALAGGIKLTRDPNKAGSEVNDTMINAFTNGVMRFRQTYPFITPSQLAFISRNYGTTSSPSAHWTNTFPNNAVFSSSVLGGLNGVSSINDQGLEEWFAKIYALTTVQSFNYRIYVVAQLTDTNGLPKGAPLKKYYQLHLRNNNPNASSPDSPSVSQNFTYEAFY